jgi:hypothetical protein
MLLSKITPRSVSSPPAEAGEHKRPRLTAAAAVKENEFICVTAGRPHNELISLFDGPQQMESQRLAEEALRLA